MTAKASDATGLREPSRASRRRVAVTGIGVKTPGGCTTDDLWASLCAGRSLAAPIASFDASALPVTFGCEVHDFVPTNYLTGKESRRLDRSVQLAVGAGLDAVAEANTRDNDPDRCAVIVGTGLGGVDTLSRQLRVSFADPERVSPLSLPMLMPNASAANLAMLLGWTGPNMALTTACASGAHAIGEGARLIRDGDSDVVLAGGTEASISPFVIGAFWRMGLLSDTNDDPPHACRPFDRARNGFVMGEGAGFVLLEAWERAEARGARIHAELIGYGRNSDASHISSPSPGGVGAAVCIELALADAGVGTTPVCHVNTHGTGTRINDDREAEALAKVFGAMPPPVTATKSVVGHLLGAAGAVEAIATLLALEDRVAPPTANFVEGEPESVLDVVSDEPRPLPDGLALSTSFGFGGHNAALLFASPRGASPLTRDS